MDTLAQLIGRDCVLWWRDAAGERCKTEGILQHDCRKARPYQIGTIDFHAGEVLRIHGADICLSSPVELTVICESEPGVALVETKSLVDARREPKLLSDDHPDVCIVRTWTLAADE